MKFKFVLSLAIAAIATFTIPEVVLAQTNANLSQRTSISQIAGEVVKVIDDDKFVLNTPNGQIVVEADSSLLGSVNLTVGEKITVSGKYDDDNEFEGKTLTRSNGKNFNIDD
ncbi:hypothetical protein PN499_17910 [Kamptonema animale CS-326]|jgi:uncharacterized protein YdeI (BOF family)|uniref:hypothetical protein n=1 Tax=Kamptonema animale TaxID=92934 RepID=UPI00232B694E|nr:hypothetical protein [Kamptonema animale]MDB9513070.1 hypothetical protein [Kamptonema animale CS-326]